MKRITYINIQIFLGFKIYKVRIAFFLLLFIIIIIKIAFIIKKSRLPDSWGKPGREVAYSLPKTVRESSKKRESEYHSPYTSYTISTPNPT